VGEPSGEKFFRRGDEFVTTPAYGLYSYTKRKEKNITAEPQRKDNIYFREIPENIRMFSVMSL